jgi:arylsulfatase A-like enzyme
VTLKHDFGRSDACSFPPRFGDNVEELDWSVGQIIGALETKGILDDTFVLFTSDNGPFAEEGYDDCGRTGGLRGSVWFPRPVKRSTTLV